MVYRILALYLVVFSAIGCGGNGSAAVRNEKDHSNQKRPLRIVVTTEMVAELVRHIAREHGSVTALIGSGVDPHLFRPLLRPIKKLRNADVVFYSGLTLEGRMQDFLKQADASNRPAVAVTKRLEALEPEYLRSPPEFEGHYDPHVWMDVAAWSRCADQVVETLTKIDPEHKDDYLKNARTYQLELFELDNYVRTAINSIPLTQRVLVTAHDAFGYFGRTYDIEVRSVQGVTTESEAGVQDVNELVEFLVQSKIPAIFVESSVNDKNMLAVIEGAKSHNINVRIGGQLFSDAMGAEGTYEGTYIGMIDHNATKITRALGGIAPERGLHGRLAPEPDGRTQLNSVLKLFLKSQSQLVSLNISRNDILSLNEITKKP